MPSASVQSGSTAIEVPGCKSELQWKLQQMSGIQPVTMPNPPKDINTCMWLWCEGAVGCTRCCAMLAALAPSSYNQGCGRCAHQLSEHAHACSPCLNINHKPLETSKHVVVEPCKWWQRCPVGLLGEMEVLCRAMASPYFEVQEPLQACTPCFHASRRSIPHPEFCYEISMLCALMACYLLETQSVEVVGKISPGPGRVVGEIA
jgi:hypothetical protein